MLKSYATHEYEHAVYNTKLRALFTKKYGETYWDTWLEDSNSPTRPRTSDVKTAYPVISYLGNLYVKFGTDRETNDGIRLRLLERRGSGLDSYLDEIAECNFADSNLYVENFAFDSSSWNGEVSAWNKILLKPGRQIKIFKAETLPDNYPIHSRNSFVGKSPEELKPYDGRAISLREYRAAVGSIDDLYVIMPTGDLYDVVEFQNGTYKFVKHGTTNTQPATKKENTIMANNTPVKMSLGLGEMATGMGAILATDAGVRFVTRKFAQIAIERGRIDIAETLIDPMTRDVAKFAIPTTLLGLAYAFSDSDDEATRKFCEAITPALKATVVANGADVMKHAIAALTGDEEKELEMIREQIRESKRGENKRRLEQDVGSRTL